MNSLRANYSAAKIFFDGPFRGGDDQPIDVYRMETGDDAIWFVGTTKFSKNGFDFTIIISEFGLTSKSSAGNVGSEWLRRFDMESAAQIKTRLLAFFMNDEAKPFYPYKFANAKCVGVAFSNDWIRPA